LDDDELAGFLSAADASAGFFSAVDSFVPPSAEDEAAGDDEDAAAAIIPHSCALCANARPRPMHSIIRLRASLAARRSVVVVTRGDNGGVCVDCGVVRACFLTGCDGIGAVDFVCLLAGILLTGDDCEHMRSLIRSCGI
jgi:hypothetical protein